jgi:hypothetical protein
MAKQKERHAANSLPVKTTSKTSNTSSGGLPIAGIISERTREMRKEAASVFRT